jgi:hypothetical protein
MSWSLDDYCASQSVPNREELPPSSRLFLERLNLPSIHPFCENPSSFYLDDIPPSGPTTIYSDHELHPNVFQAALTFYTMKITPHLAFAELWLRLLSSLIAPACLLFLIRAETKQQQQQQEESSQKKKKSSSDRYVAAACVWAVLCSALIMTDSQL